MNPNTLAKAMCLAEGHTLESTHNGYDKTWVLYLAKACKIADILNVQEEPPAVYEVPKMNTNIFEASPQGPWIDLDHVQSISKPYVLPVTLEHYCLAINIQLKFQSKPMTVYGKENIVDVYDNWIDNRKWCPDIDSFLAYIEAKSRFEEAVLNPLMTAWKNR